MIELGLQRISRLLATTPFPWRAIHVAGTNGKGSVCAYISAMLEVYNVSTYRQTKGHSRLKHGSFTSPHLIDCWDCIIIDQKPVTFGLFDKIEKEVLQRNEEKKIQASEFELLTATAFTLFTRSNLDVAVVEVGMGGRLDATNVIGQPVDPTLADGIDTTTSRPPPLVTAITKIGMDHQAFLGDTIAEIAKEKAGIIKHGTPVVYDRSNDEVAIRAIEAQAAAHGNHLVHINNLGAPIQLSEPSIAQAVFSGEILPSEEQRTSAAGLSMNESHHTREQVGAMPQHTSSNISVAFRSTWTALQVLDRVPKDFHNISGSEAHEIGDLASSMLHEAAHNVKFPGRLQFLNIQSLTGRKEDILLDGAHNAQSAAVLGQQVNKVRLMHPGVGITWVLAASESKDLQEILQPLLKAGDQVYAVEFGPVDGMPWVKPKSSKSIVQAAQDITNGSIEVHDCGRDILRALQAASAGKDGAGRPIVVAGSLYLVGDVLRLIRDARV